MDSTSPSNTGLGGLGSPTTDLWPVAFLPAVSIAGLGIGCCMLARVPIDWFPIVWFAAGGLIYTVDRWADSGPDSLAVGKRRRVPRRLTAAPIVVVSLILVLGPPLLQGEFVVAALLAGGMLLCLNYSIQLPGMPRRWRDRPILKSLLPALAVTAAILSIPALRGGMTIFGIFVWSFWVWSVLQINVWLCDLRDVEDDLRAGLSSLPILMGHSASRTTLAILAGCSWAGASMLAGIGGGAQATVWVVWLTTGYFSIVSLLGARKRSSRFYDVFVDGGLLLPVILLGGMKLVAS